MKPHLTEHSDVRCLAECDPTPSRTNVARQLRFARLRRFSQLPSRPPLVALGVGFNSRSDLRPLALRKSRAH